MLQNNALNTLFDEYEKSKIDTLEGKHGETPQYFMMYVQFVHYYLMLSLSIRTADFFTMDFSFYI